MAKKVQKKKKKTSPKKFEDKKKWIIYIAFCLILIIGGLFWAKTYLSQPESFGSNKYYIKGIDLSHHNPIPNWSDLKEQNISFAYLKATEDNSHQDRNYPYNYDLGRKSGIIIGSYHFYSFGISGKEQAKHFFNTAKCQTGDLIPAIDVEHSSKNIYSNDSSYVDLVVNELKILENEFYEYYGVHPLIYTNKDCYKLYIKNNFDNNFIWISDLHKEPDNDIKNWRIWQFSHKGELPGMPEKVDLNYYRYSFDEFKELLLP